MTSRKMGADSSVPLSPGASTALPQQDAQVAFMTGLKAFSAEVDRAGALPELVRLAREADSIEELADVVESALEELSPGEEEYAPLLRQAAALHEELGRFEAADRLWETLRAARSGEPAGQEVLARMRVELLAELAARAPSPGSRHGLLCRRGLLLEQNGEEAEAARTYSEALALAPGDEAVRSRLERLLESGTARDVAARALEPLYRAFPNDVRLARVLEVRLEGAPPSEQRALLEELAQVREARGEFGLALLAQLRAFALEPGDAAGCEALERLARTADAIEEVLAAYQDQLERDLPEAQAVALWRRVARLREEHLEAPVQVAEAWREVVRLAPRDASAILHLVGACRRAGASRPLAEALLAQAAVEPSVPAQVDLLYEVAQLAEDSLSEPALAIRTYEQILERAPGERGALRELARLLEQVGELRRLADILARELELLSGTEDATHAADELEVRLARLRWAHLEDAPGALALLERVLSRAPAHPGVCAELEAMAREPGAHGARAADLLSFVLERTGDFAQLADLLETRAVSAPSPEERATLWLRAATLRAGSLQSPELAFLAAARALRELPSSEQGLAWCLALAHQTGAQEELAALLAELLPGSDAPSTRARLARALARLQEEAVDPSEAIDAWREALTAQPEDVEALAALERLLTEAGRHAEWASLLERRLEGGSIPPDREQLLSRLAAARERAGDDGGAVEALREALLAAPASRELLVWLERLLARLRRFSEQAEVLDRLGALSGGEEQRSYRAQQVHALVAAGELAQARAVLRELLVAAPGDAELLEALTTLVRAGLAHPGEPSASAGPDAAAARAAGVLAGTLEGLDPEVQLRILEDLAAHLEREEVRVLAFAAWQRAFFLRPAEARVRAGLERLAGAAGLIDALLAAYEARIAEAGPEALELLRRLAELLEQHGQRERAVKAWEELAVRSPAPLEPLRALARLHREADQPERLAEVLLRQVPLVPGPDAQVDLLYEVAELCEGLPSGASRAAHAYQEILARTPEDRAALKSLARLLEEEGRTAEWMELLEQELRLLEKQGAVEEAMEQELRLARLVLEQGDHAQALPRFERVLRRKPEHPEVVAALEGPAFSEGVWRGPAARLLEPLYRKRGDRRALAAALEVLLEDAEPLRRLELLDEVARLRERLGEKSGAFGLLLRRWALRPEDEATREWLERLAEETEMFDALAAAYEEQLEVGMPDAPACELWRRLAVLRDERLGAPEEALRAWEEVSRRAPRDAVVLSLLAHRYRQAGAYRELARVLGRQVEVAPSVEAQVELLLELAQLADGKLADAVLAADCCRRILERRPKELRAIQLLEPLLEEAGQHQELAALLRAQVSLADARGAQDEALELLLRLARLQLSTLASGQGALEALEDVLWRRPEHPEALAALRELARMSGPAAERAARMLEALSAQAASAPRPSGSGPRGRAG